MKKKISRVVVILIMSVLLLLLGGCVLIKSTNYEELRVEHRLAIRFIEDGLQYLENKYGERFVYHNYFPTGLLERKCLIAQLEETALKDPEADLIKVYFPTRDDPNYSDNYMIYVVTPIYLYQHPDDVPDDIYAIDGKIGGTVRIFLDSSFMSEDEFDIFVENYKAWSIEHKMLAAGEFTLLNPNILEKMTVQSYINYVGKENYIKSHWYNLGE